MSVQTITNLFKTRIIENTADGFASLYYFYSRAIADGPETLTGTKQEELDTLRDILALKKLNSSDFAIGFSKVEWTSGEVYDQYSSNVNMANVTNPFIVYVEDLSGNYEVYKCLNNNGGVASTVQPGTSSAYPEDDDGYVWKMIFEIPVGMVQKFNFTNYLPVYEDSTFVESAVAGTIDRCDVLQGGSGYELVDETLTPFDPQYFPIYFSGNGDEVKTATLEISTLPGVTGEIDTIVEINNGGSGYLKVLGKRTPVVLRQINVDDDINESAYGLATVNDDGEVTSVQLVSTGSGYTDSASIQIVQSSAIAYAEATAGVITSIEMETNGQNYTRSTPILMATSGSGAVLQSSLSPAFGHGYNAIEEVNVNSLLISTDISYDEGDDFSTSNDFRTIGLLAKPLEQDADGLNVALSTSETLDAKTTIGIDPLSVITPEPDEEVFGSTSGAKGYVVDYYSGDDVIRITLDNYNRKFQVGETISIGGETTTIQYINQPEYVPYSGQVLFINNDTAISRSDDQVETLNFVLTI